MKPSATAAARTRLFLTIFMGTPQVSVYAHIICQTTPLRNPYKSRGDGLARHVEVFVLPLGKVHTPLSTCFTSGLTAGGYANACFGSQLISPQLTNLSAQFTMTIKQTQTQPESIAKHKLYNSLRRFCCSQLNICFSPSIHRIYRQGGRKTIRTIQITFFICNT